MKKLMANLWKLVVFCLSLLSALLIFGNEIVANHDGTMVILYVVLCCASGLVIAIGFEKFRSIFRQIATGLLPVFLYDCVSVLFNASKWDYSSAFAFGLMLFFPVYLYLLVIFIVDCFKNLTGEKIVAFFKDNKAMLIVMIIIVITRLPFMTLIQRWDAGEYYYRLGLALDGFNYTSIADMIKYYALCDHSASLFTMVYLIGEMIFPRLIVGVTLVSLILTLITMWCVYKILQKITRTTTKTKCAVYTLLISITPLVYAFTTHMNLDYPLAMFVVMIICCYVYDKAVHAGILSLFCFQTKETGLVIVAGIAVGEIIRLLFEYKGQGIKKIFKSSKLYTTLFAALVQLYYFRTYGSNWNGSEGEKTGGMFRWNSNGMDCFGFNTEYITMKFKQQFILNFNWIVLLVILLGTIYIIANSKYLRIKHNKDKRLKENNKGYVKYGIVVVAAALTAHSLFSYLYITQTCVRYNIVSDILIYIIAIYVIEQAIYVYHARKKENIRTGMVSKVALGLWTLLIFAESFVTIDPLSKAVFVNVDGVTMDTLLMTNIYPSMVYGESLIHNTQYHCYDEAMDKMLKETGYSPDDTDIILYDDGGVFISGNTPLYYLNWDSRKQKRVFYSNEDTEQMSDYYIINTFYNKDIVDILETQLKDRGVFVICTYFMEDINYDKALDALQYFYDISERKEASTYQGGIYYYELTLKK